MTDDTQNAPAATEQPEPPRSLSVFTTVWLGQLVSLIGSGLTGFALGIWVFQKTGSVTDYSIICFFSTLPGIVLAPIAGIIADRWNRRRAMMVADIGSGACMLAMAILLFADRLAIWHIWIIMGISASFRTLQLASYAATMTLIVPREHYARANGAVQTALAVAQICAPGLGSLLLPAIGIRAILAINVASFLVAVATLTMVRFPPVPQSGEKKTGSQWIEQLTFGLHYIRAQKDLLLLLVFFACINYSFGFSFALITPLILSTQPEAVLWKLITVGGVGMLAGGVSMSVWGGPRRRVYGVFAGAILLGVGMIVVGVTSTALMMGVAMWIGFFSVPIAAACFQTIWQSRVPPDLQGRVFATRNMLTDATVPLAFLLAGPMADHLPTISTVWSSSSGMLLSITGAALMLVTIGSCFVRTLRSMNEASIH